MTKKNAQYHPSPPLVLESKAGIFTCPPLPAPPAARSGTGTMTGARGQGMYSHASSRLSLFPQAVQSGLEIVVDGIASAGSISAAAAAAASPANSLGDSALGLRFRS